MHCFTGNPEQAQQALDLGFYLSFSGVVTYPKATEVHESARYAPLDRILVETDAPYLAPVPFRGKRNEPSYVAHTANRIAESEGIDPEELGETVVRNFDTIRRNRIHRAGGSMRTLLFYCALVWHSPIPNSGETGCHGPDQRSQADSRSRQSGSDSSLDTSGRFRRRPKWQVREEGEEDQEKPV